MRPIYIVAARRTPIKPKNGELRAVPFFELAACAIRAVLSDLRAFARLAGGDTNPGNSVKIHSVIAGNALGAGGNPARLMSLAAGLPPETPALSVDTQCCSGIDAIGLGFDRLKSRSELAPAFLIAGGAESASLAPIRQHRQSGEIYEEAPFTPWPSPNQNMIQAAHALGQARHFSDEAIVDWVSKSFEADAGALAITPCCGSSIDRDPRLITATLIERSAGFKPYSPVLMAPMADGAAFVALTTMPSMSISSTPVLEVLSHHSVGTDPQMPGLSCSALDNWLSECEAEFGFHRRQLIVSLMESFVVQVLSNIQDLGLNPALVNPWGGLLSRGHPIGASGAVLVCDLFDHLKPRDIGLALIPAAGGLASGLLVRRVTQRP